MANNLNPTPQEHSASTSGVKSALNAARIVTLLMALFALLVLLAHFATPKMTLHQIRKMSNVDCGANLEELTVAMNKSLDMIIAICDQDDNVLFAMSNPDEGFGHFELPQEVLDFFTYDYEGKGGLKLVHNHLGIRNFSLDDLDFILHDRVFSEYLLVCSTGWFRLATRSERPNKQLGEAWLAEARKQFPDEKYADGLDVPQEPNDQNEPVMLFAKETIMDYKWRMQAPKLTITAS